MIHFNTPMHSKPCSPTVYHVKAANYIEAFALHSGIHHSMWPFNFLLQIISNFPHTSVEVGIRSKYGSQSDSLPTLCQHHVNCVPTLCQLSTIIMALPFAAKCGRANSVKTQNHQIWKKFSANKATPVLHVGLQLMVVCVGTSCGFPPSVKLAIKFLVVSEFSCKIKAAELEVTTVEVQWLCIAVVMSGGSNRLSSMLLLPWVTRPGMYTYNYNLTVSFSWFNVLSSVFISE